MIKSIAREFGRNARLAFMLGAGPQTGQGGAGGVRGVGRSGSLTFGPSELECEGLRVSFGNGRIPRSPTPFDVAVCPCVS
jgi:hypothetical protein